jgi:hypothetical protein
MGFFISEATGFDDHEFKDYYMHIYHSFIYMIHSIKIKTLRMNN